MYQLKKKYTAIRQYWLDEKSHVITESSSSFHFGKQGVDIRFDSRYPTIRYIKDLIGIYSYPNLFFLNADTLEQEAEISFNGMHIEKVYDDYYICIAGNDDELISICILDKSSNILHQTPALPIWRAFFYDKKIVYTVERSPTALYCFSIELGKELWHVNLKELFQNEDAYLSGNVIFFDSNVLFCIMNSYGDLYTSYVLDIDTGALLHKIDLFSNLAVYEGKIYHMRMQELKCYDLLTKESTSWDLSPSLSALNLTILGSIIIRDNQIFFSAVTGPNSLILSYVGIISLSTHELEWATELLEDYSMPSTIDNRYSIISMQVNNSTLAIHCAGNTLFHFSKD